MSKPINNKALYRYSTLLAIKILKRIRQIDYVLSTAAEFTCLKRLQCISYRSIRRFQFQRSYVHLLILGGPIS